MNETILQLHGEMDQAIEQLDNEETPPARIERYVEIATGYWKRVKQHLRQTGFSGDAEEIDFFKNQKVRFTGLLEYYILQFRFRLHAAEGKIVLEQFRQREADRIRAFRETHAPFIQYYEQGRTEWDDLYFLRRKYNKTQRPPSQVYDRAADFWTNGDWIVTLLYANGRMGELLVTLGTSFGER